MRMLRKVPKDGEYPTSITVNDVDMDDVTVNYSIQRPEPDVNVPGGIEIEGVWFEGKDVQDQMSAYEVEQLALEIDDYLVSMLEAAEEDRGRE